MKFTDKLDHLMKKNGLNKRTFALKCDIPYTTVCGWYDRGYDGVRMSTIRKISEAFDTSLEYWAYDELDETEKSPAPEGTEDEAEVTKVIKGLTGLLKDAGWIREGGDITDEQYRALSSYVIAMRFFFHGGT